MDVVKHYDLLIDEGNDPFFDPPALREYMNLWDGDEFINAMQLNDKKRVLEIGVGTGRIAVKVLPHCKSLVGIDISPKTIQRAKQNLQNFNNAELICEDFNKWESCCNFDVIYSSLTLMHFEDKQAFVSKVKDLLKSGGLFVLSIDKNQSDFIDMGSRKLQIYPDTPKRVLACIKLAGLKPINHFQTELAHIFVCKLV